MAVHGRNQAIAPLNSGAGLPTLIQSRSSRNAVQDKPERWQSGRMYLTRNQAYRKVPWVRIPPSPPDKKPFATAKGFVIWRGAMALRTSRVGCEGFGLSAEPRPAACRRIPPSPPDIKPFAIAKGFVIWRGAMSLRTSRVGCEGFGLSAEPRPAACRRSHPLRQTKKAL